MINDMNEDFLIRLNYVETSEPDRVAKELQQQDQRIAELEKENEELKEQLKGAIVPRFRVGQEVYVASTAKNITQTKRVVSGVHYTTKRNYLTLTYQYKTYWGQIKKSVYNEDMQKVFATEQEAREKLEGMENEK